MSNNAARTFRVFKKSDKSVLEALTAVLQGASLSEPKVTVSYSQDGGSPQRSGPIPSILEQLPFLDNQRTLIGRFTANGTHDNQTITILICREDGFDTIDIRQPQGFDFEKCGEVIGLIQKHFTPYERTDAIDKLLGAELAEFYRKRDEALTRLEQTQVRLVEQQEAYQRRLQDQTEEIREQVRQDGEAYKAELEAKHTSRMEEQDKREAELDERVKQIDDRDSKHARRQHQKEIKDALKELDTNFTLSTGTARKRRSMHVVFIAGLAFSLAGVIYTVSVDPDLSKVATWVKMGLGSATFIGFATAYLRWMNHWFNQHANEEFRLKRLSLDIDRASWLVETVSEWQAEHPDQPLPDELLRQLGEGLFSPAAKEQVDEEHPLSTLLGASSHLQLNSAGTTLDIDRKGMNKLKKS